MIICNFREIFLKSYSFFLKNTTNTFVYSFEILNLKFEIYSNSSFQNFYNDDLIWSIIYLKKLQETSMTNYLELDRYLLS